MTSQIDEYFVDTMKSYDDKPFCNIATDDLGLESEEEKKETEAKQAEDKELLDFVKETLGEQVASVRLSNKLVSSAVCLSTEGGVTLEMERYFRSMPGAPTDIRAVRVLELNANHHAYQTMKEAFARRRQGQGRTHRQDPARARRCSSRVSRSRIRLRIRSSCAR